MKNNLLFSLLLIFGISLFSCISNKEYVNNDMKIPNLPRQLKDYEVAAQEKYKGNIYYIQSPDAVNVLCINSEKPSAEKPFSPLKFFIWNKMEHKIIYEDSHENGNVKWVNEHMIKISFTPNQERIDEQNSGHYYYDLETQKKYLDVMLEAY